MKSTSFKSTVSTRSSTLDQAPAAPAMSALRKPDAFIGIDYHKSYSVYHVVDAEGAELAKGRIQHACPEALRDLVNKQKDREDKHRHFYTAGPPVARCRI